MSKIYVDEIAPKTTGGGIIIDVPVFKAEGSDTDQSISAATSTKLEMPTVVFDTHGYYDAANYRFTPKIAGYYQFYGKVRFKSGSTKTESVVLHIYKNGSSADAAQWQLDSSTAKWNNPVLTFPTTVIYANGTTDYFEPFIYSNQAGTATDTSSQDLRSQFGGHLVRGA